VTTFGFNLEDAKRIGRAVRLVERDEPRQELVGDQAGVVSRGVRLLLAKYAATSQWTKESTAVVTVYNGTTLASAVTVVAHNQFVTFPSNTACTHHWVALGHNGWGWEAVSRERACTETCSMDWAGVDFSVMPGYAATATQVLGHIEGCIKWLNVTTCSTSTTG